MSKAQDNVILNEIRRIKSNLDEMENIIERHKFYQIDSVTYSEDRITKFMEHCINSIKDLHEENTKLWKAIAELLKKEER